jgi:hypothetical protein
MNGLGDPFLDSRTRLDFRPRPPDRTGIQMRSIVRAFRMGIVLLTHTAVAMVAAGCLWILGHVWDWLYPAQEPRALDVVPFRYILDIGFAAIIVVFLVGGIIETIEAFRGSESGHQPPPESGRQPPPESGRQALPEPDLRPSPRKTRARRSSSKTLLWLENDRIIHCPVGHNS